MGVEVDSGITDRPLNKDVTLKGVINRARNTKKENPDADFWIGLEGGLHDYGEGYHLITYACLVNKTGDEFTGEGVEIHLPESVSDKVKKGKQFGEAIRIYAKEYEIDKNLISRDTPFTEAIQNAYVNYLKEKGNLGYREKSAAIVINNKKQLLLVQLQAYRDSDWNIPGGGVDEGETPEEALKRELKEELGTDKFEILEKSKIKNQYEWPSWLIAKDIVNKKPNIYRGQAMNQFIVRFTGSNSDIKIQEEEIRKYKWVEYNELEEHLSFEGQWENIKKVIEESSLEL